MNAICKNMFPQVRGRDLVDNDVVLPSDANSECTLLVITYKRWHQDLIDTWTPYLGHLTNRFSELRLYYVSMFKSTNQFMRVIINGYMKRRYASKADRVSTIIVYTDIDAFNLCLNLPSTTTMYLLLIDREGHVLWRGQDAFDQQQFDTLCTTINDLLNGSERGA